MHFLWSSKIYFSCQFFKKFYNVLNFIKFIIKLQNFNQNVSYTQLHLIPFIQKRKIISVSSVIIPYTGIRTFNTLYLHLKTPKNVKLFLLQVSQLPDIGIRTFKIAAEISKSYTDCLWHVSNLIAPFCHSILVILWTSLHTFFLSFPFNRESPKKKTSPSTLLYKAFSKSVAKCDSVLKKNP